MPEEAFLCLYVCAELGSNCLLDRILSKLPSIVNYTERLKCARGVAQQSRVLAAVKEKQSSGPSTHTREPTATCNSSALFWSS